jgi:hypothetical protein
MEIYLNEGIGGIKIGCPVDGHATTQTILQSLKLMGTVPR